MKESSFSTEVFPPSFFAFNIALCNNLTLKLNYCIRIYFTTLLNKSMKQFLSLIVPTLLFFPTKTGNVDFADTSRDRCAISYCMCQVNPGDTTAYYPRSRTSNRLSLYFPEGSDEVTDNHKRLISSFLSRYSGTRHSVSILGYTDGCGGEEYNLDLSRRRASNVKYAVKSVYPSSPSARFFGEGTSTHTPEARRVDVIVHASGYHLVRSIERIAADFYLLDASGSMSIERWKKIISASKKPGARIYVSMMRGCYSGQNIDSIRPQGGTEIWWSYWNILDRMSPGQKLLIISDFDSNVPLTPRERALIEQKVRQRGVTVEAIRL